MKVYSRLACLCMSVFLMCSCNGLENSEPLDDGRLMIDFTALLASVQDGAEVAEIVAVERDGSTVGYLFFLADGSRFALMDFISENADAKSVNGLSEDAGHYYFELEDGERITLPKPEVKPFKVEIEGDEVEITDGGTVTASYKVTGADENLEVTAMAGEGWSVALSDASASEGSVTVAAPSPITTDKVLVSFKDGSGRQIVRALRLTVKNTVQRGNIDTYVYHGVRYRHVNPAFIDHATAISRYQAVPDAGVQIMTCDGDNRWDNPGYPDEVLTQLDFAEAVGLKLAVCVDCYLGDVDYPSHLEELKVMVNKIKDHPALWGYQLIDEPNADRFPMIYEGKSVIEAIDNEHLCYINLHGDGGTFGPNGSYHTVNYDEYLERCVNEVQPDFLTFDVYPCISDRVIDYPWYTSLEQVAAKSRKYGTEFWAFAATCRFQDGHGWQAIPTLATIRLQDYTNLAYGAQGLEYFTWAATSGDCSCWVLDGNGDINTQNPTYEYLQTVNREVQNRAFVFDGCDVKWTAHYNNVPVGCTAFEASQLPGAITSVSSKDSFLMSHIENDGGESEYFCIVSRTHLKATDIHLRLRYPVQTVERDGSIGIINPGDHDFTIEPGDILIIKIK